MRHYFTSFGLGSEGEKYMGSETTPIVKYLPEAPHIETQGGIYDEHDAVAMTTREKKRILLDGDKIFGYEGSGQTADVTRRDLEEFRAATKVGSPERALLRQSLRAARSSRRQNQS